MNAIDLNALNRVSPYLVIAYHDEYLFRTDHDIEYAVDFKQEEIFDPIPAYWFDLSNRSHKVSPNDSKVRETVIRIIMAFFDANPDILLYMCDTANDQQAQRNRLFLRWFNGAEQSKMFYIRTAKVMDEDVENFIAIIVPRSHPFLQNIVERFNAEVAMFNEMKP